MSSLKSLLPPPDLEKLLREKRRPIWPKAWGWVPFDVIYILHKSPKEMIFDRLDMALMYAFCYVFAQGTIAAVYVRMPSDESEPLKFMVRRTYWHHETVHRRAVWRRIGWYHQNGWSMSAIKWHRDPEFFPM